MSDDETYVIILDKADETGSRKHVYFQGNGWTLGREPNGVVSLINQGGTVIEYNPYAWQSIRIDNIDTQEDTDG